MALDLAGQLESQPIHALRRVAAEAAGLAVTRIQLADPAVITRVPANGLAIGAGVRLRLDEADPPRRLTRFSIA